VKMTRLSCYGFRSNEVRLWLSLIAYHLGNLWRRLVLPLRVGNWSLTSLQQQLVKTGGRLIKHARYYWLLLAEGHLTRRLFGAMVRRIEAPPEPAGVGEASVVGKLVINDEVGGRKVSVESGERAAVAGPCSSVGAGPASQGRHSGEKMSLSGSQTHLSWYADVGREAKKEIVDETGASQFPREVMIGFGALELRKVECIGFGAHFVQDL